MMNSFSLLLVSFLLTGCASNKAMNYFEKEPLFAQALQYTKKCDIVYNNQVKVMVTAMYLNSVDEKYQNEHENFIVGVYVVETHEYNEMIENNPSYKLLLNETPVLSISPLTQAHEMYGNMPLNNAWANYYVVQFNEIKTEKNRKLENPFNITQKTKNTHSSLQEYDVSLQLHHTILGSCVLSFPKE